MKRMKRRASIIIWTILVAGVRALYVFLNWNMATDYYGYYEHAMIRAEESTPLLSSGLVYAYTNVLSKLLSLCGNHLEAVLVFQGILQLAALYCFLRAMWYLCGRQAAFLSATILAAIPSVLIATTNAEPISFYLFHFSLVSLMIGYFYTLSREEGWRRSSICEFYLMLMGFYLGVVCIWNYAGFLLVILFAGVLVKTHLVTKELIRRQDHDLLEEKDQIMSTLSKAFIVFLGMFIGMFATLMKYTGISGEVISGQIRWWIGQFRDLPGTCQGLELKYVIDVVTVILAGILCNIGRSYYEKHREEVSASGQEKQKLVQKEERQNKEQQRESVDHLAIETENPGERMNPEMIEREDESEEKSTAALEDWRFDLDDIQEEDWRFQDELQEEEKQPENPDFFVTEDGRKVKYLDNPLPGPKKHVSRQLDFDFEVNMDDMLAFDRKLDEIKERERKDR